MATVRFSINPGDSEFGLIQATGVATQTKLIELTVDQSPTAIIDANAPGGVRAIKVGEVITALQQMIERLNSDQPQPGVAPTIAH